MMMMMMIMIPSTTARRCFGRSGVSVCFRHTDSLTEACRSMQRMPPPYNGVVATAGGRNRWRSSSLSIPAVREFNSSGSCLSKEMAEHCLRLESMYAAAPINGLINDHNIKIDPTTGGTVLHFTPRIPHCHTAGSLHGSGYFKLLDDTAFFSAQSRVSDVFLYTTSFTIYMTRPVLPGTPLTATGSVVSTSKSLIVAESRILEKETGKLVAQGSGTFMRGYVKLLDLPQYKDGGAAGNT